jgi:hypothetical protein
LGRGDSRQLAASMQSTFIARRETGSTAPVRLARPVKAHHNLTNPTGKPLLPSMTTGNMGESPPCPGPESSPAARLYRHRRDGSWYPVHPGSGGWRGPAAPQTVSCNSGVPPVARGRFVPCWWARLMVESTETVQSITPAASASARSLPWIRSHVPSEAKRR